MNNRKLSLTAFVLLGLSFALLLMALRRRDHMETTTSDNLLAEANKHMAAGDYAAAKAKFIEAANAGGGRVTCLAGGAECSFRLGAGEDKFTLELCERLKQTEGGIATAKRICGATHWRAGKKEEGRTALTVAARMGDPEAAKMLKLIDMEKP